MDDASQDTTLTTESRDEVRATMPDTRVLRVAVTALTTVTPLAKVGRAAEVEFAERGVTIRVLDGWSCVLAELSMPAAALREYLFAGGSAPQAVGLDVRDMQRALQGVRDDDTVSLALAARGDGAGGDRDARLLCLRVVSRDGTMRASIALPRAAGLDAHLVAVPAPLPPLTAVTSARSWQLAIDMLSVAAGDAAGPYTYMDVDVDERAVSISLAGGDGADGRSAFATLPAHVYCEMPLRQRLLLARYLCQPAPFADIAVNDTLLLYLTPDRPAQLRYPLGDMGDVVLHLGQRHPMG